LILASYREGRKKKPQRMLFLQHDVGPYRDFYLSGGFSCFFVFVFLISWCQVDGYSIYAAHMDGEFVSI
jgi:hypothetical protein